MRRSLSLLPLVLLGFLIAACSGTSSQASHPGSTPTPLKSGVRVLVVPAPGTGTPTQAALSSARKTLARHAFAVNQVMELLLCATARYRVALPGGCAGAQVGVTL